MFEQIEHPDITAACRTGYPSWRQEAEPLGECHRCGEEIFGNIEFDDFGRMTCPECKEKGEESHDR